MPCIEFLLEILPIRASTDIKVEFCIENQAKENQFVLIIIFLTEVKILCAEFSHLMMELLGCSPVEVLLAEF
jgi:hypothetical protein